MSFSKPEDAWSIKTPPRLLSPKRQKTASEIIMKIEYPVKKETSDHTLHVFLLQILSTSLEGDVRILNKRGELLKESVIPALTDLIVTSLQM